VPARERGCQFPNSVIAQPVYLVLPENGRRELFYNQTRYVEDSMSGDSVPWALPLAHFRTSDREATTLFRELRQPLLRYLVCLGLSSDEAQDVVQDTFLSLHRHFAQGGSEENIRSWLFRVAHNQARNRQNSYDRRFSARLEDVAAAGAESVLDEATPERVLLEKEKFERLGNAIRTLEKSERECLLLRASGLRYREIGEVLGIATSTVADIVDRAVRKLAEKCNV
jgi:RNA polymerase sigma-70 factor (ECF subfamily)